MANQLKYKVGAQWRFAYATEYAPAAANDLSASGSTITAVELDIGGVANGGGRNSTKADLGASRARQFSVDACIEFAANPTNGEVVSIYWSPSPSGTAGYANAGSTSGADAAYTIETGLLGQMIHIGDLVLDDGASTHKGHIGVFEPPHRYGSIVVYNQATPNLGAVTTNDAVECSIVMSEIIDEAQ